MCRIFLLFFLFCLTCGFQLKFGQNRFSQIVMFGDSYSDTGNVYKLTNYTWPIVPPYYQGRFSNGPIWFDRLSNIDKINYAYGGATTDNNFIQGLTKLNTIPVPGVRQQIAMYFNNTPINTIDFNLTLYILWAGGNDLFFNSTVSILTIVNSYMNGVKDLLAAGAKNLLIFNQPPIQLTPYIRQLNQTAAYTAIVTLGNNGIVTGLTALQQNYTNASIYMFDAYTLLTQVISNTSSVTFANNVGQCWDNYNITSIIQYCSDPTKYVFIDSFHFTSPVHQILSDAVHSFLSYRFNRNTPNCYIQSF